MNGAPLSPTDQKFMNTYEEKRTARKKRYEDLATRKRKQASALHNAGMTALHQIPFGQPILVGHHSEKSDRSYRSKACGKIERSFEISKTADYYEHKASHISDCISSDDPDAIVKLEAKLATLKERHEFLKTEAKKIRAAGGKVDSFHMTNNGANIRTVQKRIDHLKKMQLRKPNPDVVGNGFIMRENAAENRIQFIFDGKPSEEIRALLKQNGFRWSPTNNAWQTFLNGHGQWKAKNIIATLITL